MTVSMRRLTRDLRARSARFEELDNRPALQPSYDAEVERIRDRLRALDVDLTDRDQVRAVLATVDVFTAIFDATGPQLAVIAAGFCATVLDVVALDPAAVELVLPDEVEA